MPGLQIAKVEPLGIASVEPLSIARAEPAEAPSMWDRVGDATKRYVTTVGSDIGGMAMGLGKMLITPLADQGREIGLQLADRYVDEGAGAAGVDVAGTVSGVPLRQMYDDYQQGRVPELLGHATVAAGALLGPHLVGKRGGVRVPAETAPHVMPKVEMPTIAKAEPLPQFGPHAFAGPERRTAGGVAPGGIERRVFDEPLNLSNPVEAASRMMQENPQILKESTELAARARASRTPAPPRETANDAGLPPGKPPVQELRTFTNVEQAPKLIGDTSVKLRELAEIQNQPEGRASAPGTTVTTGGGLAARLRRRYVNQFAEVEDLMRAGGLDPLAEPAAHNPVKAIDLAHGGTPGKIERASELFKSVLDDAEKTGIAEPLQDYLNLNAMEAGAETLKNRALRDGDMQALTSLEKGEKLPQGFTPAELRAARESWNARPEAERAPVEQLAKRVFKLNEDTLDRSYEAGLIRPEVYADLKGRAAKAEQTGQGGYSPLNRILDEVGSEYQKAGMNMPTQHVLYNLEGSERATQHPLVTSLKRTAIAMQEAEKNRAVQTLVDLPQNYPSNPLFAATIKSIEKGAKPPEGYGLVSVFKQGERVDYAVPTPLAETVKALDGPTTRVLGETLLRWTGGIFRTGTTTANLAFAVPNVLRDISDLRRMETLPGHAGVGAAVTKEVPVLPIAKDWAQSWFKVATKDPKYLEFLDSGAAFSTFQKSMKNTHELLGIVQQKGLLRSAGRIVSSPLDAVKWVNNSLEEASKLTAYTRQRAAGAKVEDAAWQTRRFGGSPDFARRGSDIAALNQVVPFINAQIQGVVRIIPYVKRHPAAAGGALAAITGKMALVQMYNNSFSDPDGTKSWDRITDVEKQSNWILFVPGTFAADGVTRQNYIKIPAGHTVNLFRAPIQAMLDPKTRTAGGVLDSVAQQMPMSPNLDLSSPSAAGRSAADSVVSGLNPALKVPIEQMMNRDTFRGVPIVPRRLENVAAPEQFTDTTSKTAVKAGQAIGASPLRIQHAVRGVLGGVADQGLSIGDAVLDPTSALTKPPILTPLAKRFIGGLDPGVDQVERNRNNAFYQALQKSETATATLSALKKRGDLARAEQFLQNPETQQAISRATALQRVAQQINKLRAAQDRDGERELLKSVEKFLTAQEQPK